MSEPNWMNDAAGRIFTYAIEWNEGRKVWRDDDIMNIIKHASAPEVITGGCICGHGFNDHEHPAAPWMAINSKMMSTELAACKLCDCDMWREPESLMDNFEAEKENYRLRAQVAELVAALKEVYECGSISQAERIAEAAIAAAEGGKGDA